ncbi:hypothetical protein WEU41_17310 [Pseudomonas fragi]|uniref:hypothetical protein n=1 Tax=Pseudomonas fragi TaxID=296 RepID=UPI0030ADAEB5
MAFNTGNPIGSTSPKDLSDNARNLDLLLLGDDPSYPDRKGVPRKSWKGMETGYIASQLLHEAEFNAAQIQRTNAYMADKKCRDAEFMGDQADRLVEFNHFLESSGFEIPIDYAPDIGITRPTQVVRFGIELYRAHNNALPFITTSWGEDSAKFFSMGDASLRQEHANAIDPEKGAVMIGRAVVSVASIASLLLQPRRADLVYSVSTYYLNGTNGGGDFVWNGASTEAEEYGSVFAVPGVSTGRFYRLKRSRGYSAYDYGVRGSNSGTENRLRLTALYKRLHGSANTVQMIDEDFIVDASRAIIVPADTTTLWGRGWLSPVLESPLLPATSAANPDGTFKCYGGIFAGGDPITGNRYSETNFIYRGRIVWRGVKIKNTYGVTAAIGYSLHGIVSHGGVNVYVDCVIDRMPNNGYATTMYREAHYIRCKGNKNGLLGGGGARNGMSNTSTYSFPSTVFPEADRTTMLTVTNGQFTYNYEEGIQYANVPFVYISGNDCKFNGDRAIEGDSAYPQLVKTRPNDVIWILDNDCRGVPGVSNYSITSSDGFNKSIFLSGNTLGGCTKSPLVMSCSPVGSVTFTGRNNFELSDTNLAQGCHAMYINAGLIDISAGGSVTGNHDRSSFNAALLSANNDLNNGVVIFGAFNSDVTFAQALVAKSASKVRVYRVNCSTSRSFVQLTLTGNVEAVEISDSDGLLNTSGATDQGLIRLAGLNDFFLRKLVLKGNLNDPTEGTTYPVTSSSTAIAGRVFRLFSSGNYWKGFAYPSGERLTGLAGLAAKTSTNDLPVLV